MIYLWLYDCEHYVLKHTDVQKLVVGCALKVKDAVVLLLLLFPAFLFFSLADFFKIISPMEA